MDKSIFLPGISVLLVIFLLACSNPTDENPMPNVESLDQAGSSISVESKGNRRLEIHITNPEHNDYSQSLELAKELGSESVSLSIFWDEIEISTDVYSPDPNWLEIANLYYPPQDFPVSLVVSVLDTTEIKLPEYLDGKSFADPDVIIRFRSFLDYIKLQIPDLELTSLAIGNEIDGVLGINPQSWEDYTIFFTQGSEYARELWPEVPVGSKITLNGLTGPASEYAQDLNQNTDVIMVTYYPLAEDFTIRDPAVVLDDFDLITDQYPGDEIHLTEIGYPTSEVNQSSPGKQADFIRNMFIAWDNHSSQISVLSYSWLTDLPQEAVDELEEYYGLSDPAFGEFLRTLGLRTYPGAGEDKTGFQVFKEEIEKRGW